MVSLENQLTAEYKKNAEDCIEIYNKLKSMDEGRVWSSKWDALVDVRFSTNERRYKPSNIGAIFLQGLRK